MDPEDIPTLAVLIEPGAQLCGHRLDGLLGSGGFGSVYRATDLGLDREIAFKILDQTQTGMLARFRDEAKMLAHLDDPHIVPLGVRPGHLIPAKKPHAACPAA
jgi:hypothetical protein